MQISDLFFFDMSYVMEGTIRNDTIMKLQRAVLYDLWVQYLSSLRWNLYEDTFRKARNCSSSWHVLRNL